MRSLTRLTTLARSRSASPARVLLLAIACLASLATSAHADLPVVGTLVARADALRQLYPDAIIQVRMTRQSGEDAGRQSLLQVAVHGTDVSLIRVLQGIDQGQQILLRPEGIWVKLPRSARAIRITPMQRLLGDASVGDIGRLRWQDDYEARFAEPAEVVFEGQPAWRIDLVARSAAAAYPRILATLARSDARPLQAEFFLKSGKAVKSVRFGPVEAVNDRRGIRRMEFRDLLRGEGVTLVVQEKVEPRAMDERLFSLESLGSWQ